MGGIVEFDLSRHRQNHTGSIAMPLPKDPEPRVEGPAKGEGGVWDTRIKRIGAVVGILVAVLAILTGLYAGLGYMIRSELNLQLGPIRSELGSIRTDLATHGVRIEYLEKQVDKLRSIPASVIGRLIPTPQGAAKMGPTQIQQGFDRAALFIQAALNEKVPTETSSLVPVKKDILDVLRVKGLPGPVRQSGISALVHVEGYESFSDLVQRGQEQYFISKLTFSGGPGNTGIMVLPPSDAAKAVVYDTSLENLTQDITAIKWIKVEFNNAIIKYSGGPLFLADVTFNNCKFQFGDDPRSKAVLAKLTRSQGSSTSILLAQNYSSLSSAN